MAVKQLTFSKKVTFLNRSYAIIIPKDIVDTLEIKPREILEITLRKVEE